MALTKSGTKKWVDSSDTGVIAETQPIPGPGQKGTIYIPKLMPFIQFGGLQKQANVTNGNMIFKNAPDCKPNAPTVVYTQNYITATAANDANWADVQGVSGYSQVESWDQTGVGESGGTVTVTRKGGATQSGTIQQGTSVKVTFKSGNIINPYFGPA